MPELPEVETIVRELSPRLQGRHIVTAEILNSRIVRHSRSDLSDVLAGRRIEQVGRHGKFIVVRLDLGYLTVHLGMTGQLLFNAARTPYTRAVLQLDDAALHYDDIRMFGSLEWGATPERVAQLGPDILAAGADIDRIRRHRAPIKSVLLNQSVLAGLGNIYTDEALFRAGIHPKRRADKLSAARIANLLTTIRSLLEEAISCRGSSVSDYVDTEGRQGTFQQRHRVYGREGLPCVQCAGPIKRTVLAQRGTHFCPVCQR
jgi:formamidopyrimidine-DNA glycosylase